MVAHYCIGNPCWICFPEHAPSKTHPEYEFLMESIDESKIPEKGISGNLRNLLITIFAQGLDEGTLIREMNDLTIQDIINERKHVEDDSFVAILLDSLIKDYLFKTHNDK